jgi:hypothetical protein
MPMEPHRTYYYNAQGHALSAQIVRPFHHTIDVQAGMSLPTIGGYGSVRVTDFRLKEVVSFKSASTHVSGSFNEHDKSYTTMVSVVIEGLDFWQVVTADRVVARIASRHPVDEREPHITVLGSHFDNLRIAGCPVNIEFDTELFQRIDTFEKLLKELDSNKRFRKTALGPYYKGKDRKLPCDGGIVLCSLVKDMEVNCPGVTQQGHVFTVPEFGKVFVAEVVAEHSHRILTMVRFEMGSPGGGTGTAGQAQANGKTIPPPP